MHRTAMGLVAALTLLPALRAEDEPKKGPLTAAEEYKALTAGYAKAEAESDKAYKKAKTDEERQQIRANCLKVRSEFVDRLLSLAEKNPRDKAALGALFFVLHPAVEAGGGHVD